MLEIIDCTVEMNEAVAELLTDDNLVRPEVIVLTSLSIVVFAELILESMVFLTAVASLGLKV